MKNRDINRIIAAVIIVCLIAVLSVPALAETDRKIRTLIIPKKEVTIGVGDEYAVKCSFFPKNANESLEWSSSDEKVASVSQEGVVTGLDAGVAEITVTATKSNLSAICNISVKYVEADIITLSESFVSVSVGSDYQLSATLTPSTSNEPVTWTSQYPEIVSVSQTGLITALETGYSVITATTASGKRAQCTVSSEEIPSTEIIKASVYVTESGDLAQGEVYAAYITFSKALTSAQQATLMYALSSDSANVTVTRTSASDYTKNSFTITPTVEAGAVTLTPYVSSSDESLVFEFEPKTVTVLSPSPYVKSPIKSMSMDTADLSVTVGESRVLSVTANPAENDDNVIWYSSNPSVAEVSGSGLTATVTAKALGSATITAKSQGNFTANKKTATCGVVVVFQQNGEPAETPTISKSVLAGDTGDLGAEYGNIGDGTVYFESENPECVFITADGQWEAKTPGSAAVDMFSDSSKQTKLLSFTFTVENQKISVTIEKGYSVSLYDVLGTDVAVSDFTSDKTDVATVADEDGLPHIEALKEGAARITVCVTDGTVYYIDVTVSVSSTGSVDLLRSVIGVMQGSTYSPTNSDIGATGPFMIAPSWTAVSTVSSGAPASITDPEYTKYVLSITKEGVITVGEKVAVGTQLNTSVSYAETSGSSSQGTLVQKNFTIIVMSSDQTTVPNVKKSVLIGDEGDLGAEYGNFSDGTAYFMSTNPNCVTVTESGKWEARNAGSVTVDMYSDSSKQTKLLSVTFTVGNQTQSVTVAKDNTVKMSEYVKGVITGAASSKTSVAEARRLDEEWVIIGVKAGSATVTVSTYDGAVYEFNVTVTDSSSSGSGTTSTPMVTPSKQTVVAGNTAIVTITNAQMIDTTWEILGDVTKNEVHFSNGELTYNPNFVSNSEDISITTSSSITTEKKIVVTVKNKKTGETYGNVEIAIKCDGSVNPPSSSSGKLVIESKSLYKGDEDTFTVALSLENTLLLKAISLSEISYSKETFELVNGEWKIESAVNGWDAVSELGVITFEENTDVNGVLFELTFRVKEGAADGDYSIGASVSGMRKTSDGKETVVNISSENGTVEVKRNVIRGDVNGDGNVTSDDAVRVLFWYLLPDFYSVNQNCDFDGDGVVTSDDAIRLLYHTLLPDLYQLN